MIKNNPLVVKEILAMRKKGITLREISKKFNCSHEAIRQTIAQSKEGYKKQPTTIRFPTPSQMIGDAIRCKYCGFGIIPTGYTYFWYDKDEKGQKIFTKKHTRFGLCGCFENNFYNKKQKKRVAKATPLPT